ncbi:MAG: DUF4382 domain-containing protein [Mongoliibacter sp.]|uniref:DUF4382 domain-containing protein n=1 Tax=Mongoliibacter sp. TaxID=2022438 RepID=UPI0012F2B2A7|nr:DUF4382 domain-containing protein [Mongoliibacter sp.]TVP49997.1 MAG: DUF4382 domain-containing protein [Mongoliibacter sp.]
MKNKLFTMMLAMLAFFAMSSCDQQENYNTITEGNAKVNVFLVDAPADYEEVWVEVLAVRILPAENDENTDSEWVHIDHESDDRMVNLLSLVGNNEAFIGSVEVPAGRVSQIRLLLGDNNYIIKNGERIDLKTPSAQQSGLKLQVNKEFESGKEYDLIIDFDAGRSIVKAGNSGNYILKPVLRVIAETASSIQGTILPVEAEPKVTASHNGESFSTFTDENGFFRIRGIPAGSYSILIEPKEPYLPVTLEGITLDEGQSITLDTVTLEAEEE